MNNEKMFNITLTRLKEDLSVLLKKSIDGITEFQENSNTYFIQHKGQTYIKILLEGNFFHIEVTDEFVELFFKINGIRESKGKLICKYNYSLNQYVTKNMFKEQSILSDEDLKTNEYCIIDPNSIMSCNIVDLNISTTKGHDVRQFLILGGGGLEFAILINKYLKFNLLKSAVSLKILDKYNNSMDVLETLDMESIMNKLSPDGDFGLKTNPYM